MKAANSWTTYRTRFLVKARQLNSSLTFTDVLGRQHSGCKGDYLVESSDGVLRIAPRQIFEDVYVPLDREPESPKPESPPRRRTPLLPSARPLGPIPKPYPVFPRVPCG